MNEQCKEDENLNISNSSSKSILSTSVKPIPKPKFILMTIWGIILKSILWIVDLFLSMFMSLWHFIKILGYGSYKLCLNIGKFFKRKAHQFKYNDVGGRLSFIFFGSGSFAHGQIGNGIIYIVFEVAYLVLFGIFGINSIGLLGTLGVVIPGNNPDCDDMFCDWIDGDNSIMILIYGLLWCISLLVFLYVWNRSINSGYNNYRIEKFEKFNDLDHKNIEFSNKIDREIRESKDVNATSFKKLHKEEIDIYLNSYEDKFEHDYSKYLVYKTISLAYENVRLLKKENKKLENIENKLALYSKNREEQLLLINEDLYEKRETFKNKTLSKESSYKTKIRKQKHVLEEINKKYSPAANMEYIKNTNTYSKFNSYYKTIANFDKNLLFFNHYEKIVGLYEDNKDNFAEQNELNVKKTVELLQVKNKKIIDCNAKYDEIINKKADLANKMHNLEQIRNDELKIIRAESSKVEKEGLLIECQARHFKGISAIANELNEFPNDKNIKAMRKEEIVEINHAYKRDKKYLKTNFTSETYGCEVALNYMLVELKFDYSDAKTFMDKFVIIKRKNDVTHLENDQVTQYINTIELEKENFLKNNLTTYIGKPKTFKEQLKSLFNENFHISILLVPVGGILLFTIIPLMFSILIAFTNYSFGHVPPTQLFTWVGLENFFTLFNSPSDSIYAELPGAMGKTIGWTLIWTIIATFSNYFLGIILALLINKKGIRFKKIWRTIFVMSIAVPQFISLMSIGVLLKDTGAIGTWWLQTFGYRLGFGDDATNGALVSKIIIILVNIWVGIPYTMLSTTGILLNIPSDLYESARVDGAGPITQFGKITMPYILFVTGPYLITQFIGNINNFNVIFFLTGGGPNLSGTALQVGHTDLLVTFLFKMITSANNPQYGIASTVGIVIFIICSFFSIVMYNKSGAIKEEDQFQ